MGMSEGGCLAAARGGLNERVPAGEQWRDGLRLYSGRLGDAHLAKPGKGGRAESQRVECI